MYHQWFNRAEYEEKEKALIDAIKNLGSKNIKYGEQPNYDKKVATLERAYVEYLDYCKKGHQEEIDKGR